MLISQDHPGRCTRPEGSPAESSDSYARIVNNQHFCRIKALVEDAVAKGAVIAVGGATKSADNFIEPTVLDGITHQMSVMQDEIFGPVSPVLAYTNLDDVLRVVNQRERPLTRYVHSCNRKIIQ